jgi:two-component system, response regulator PdtaR
MPDSHPKLKRRLKRLHRPRAAGTLHVASRVQPRLLFSRDEPYGAPAPQKSIPRVLIVEDDYLVSWEMESVLIGAGFAVVGTAASAAEAVDLAITQEPHLVVMDIALEGARDGVEAALEIFNAKRIRCLFTTAYHDLDTRRRAEPCSPLGWLPKPYTMEALIVAVRDALRRAGGPPEPPR